MSARIVILAAALAPVLLSSTVNEDLKLGLDALDHGYVTKAEQLLSRAHEQLLRENPPDTEQLTSVRIGLSSAYQFTGRIDEADRFAQLVVEEWRRTHKQELLFSLHSLASIRGQQGRWADALALSREALAYSEKNYGADQRPTRVSMAHLANLELQTGHVEDAAAHLRKSLALARANNAGPVELSTTLINYSKASIIQGDFGAGIRLGREALVVAARAGDQPMIEAESGYTLAAAYLHAGYIERAEPLVKAALAKYETAAGPESTSSAGALMLAADIEYAKNRCAPAAEYQRRANQILRKSFGPSDLEVAIGESKLAELYLASKNRGEAAGLLGHAVPIMERSLAAPNPRLAAAYRDLGELAQTPEDSELYYRKAIATFEACKYQGRAYAYTLQRYGDLLRRAHRTEARDVLSRAKAMTNSLRARPDIGLGY